MTCQREKELLEQIEQTGEMYKVSELQLIKAGNRIAELEATLDRRTLQFDGTHPTPSVKRCEDTAFWIDERRLRARIAELESLNGALCRDSAGFVRERDALAARVDVMRVALSSVTQFAEVQICEHDETYRGGAIWEICHSCGAKWADDEGGKPVFQWAAPIIQARESIALPDISADILRARDARTLRDAADTFRCRAKSGTHDGLHMNRYSLDGCLYATVQLRNMADELEQAK